MKHAVVRSFELRHGTIVFGGKRAFARRYALILEKIARQIH